ncbi:hypothetical protein ACJX0J_036336, partial [Zea mays]
YTKHKNMYLGFKKGRLQVGPAYQFEFILESVLIFFVILAGTQHLASCAARYMEINLIDRSVFVWDLMGYCLYKEKVDFSIVTSFREILRAIHNIGIQIRSGIHKVSSFLKL